jgi:uncharacterized protein (DUF362 family)/Pyruvate/2-oxoacid:ferredoxin oxidoreductase delta subunit
MNTDNHRLFKILKQSRKRFKFFFSIFIFALNRVHPWFPSLFRHINHELILRKSHLYRTIRAMSSHTSSEVSIVRCVDYGRDRTMAAVRQAVDLLGGIKTFIKPGESVLIKPNLLKAHRPEDAVTTHPEVVRAVIRLVREADGKVMVGDSPGFGDLRKVCEKAGVMDVIQEEGAALADCEEAVTIKNTGRFQRFEIARVAYESDVIINLPKFKTHGMTVITGAVKNLFGCVPGKRKVQWHFNTGINHDLFMQMIVELYALLKPRLSIMDAVIGMEGNGPGSGDPRFIGAIIAGQDAVAVDAVSAGLVGVVPSSLPLMQAAAAAGVGQAKLDHITVRGEPLSQMAIRNFHLPPTVSTEWPLPEWLRRSLKDAFTTRPVINHGLCPQCGVCQSHCPQGAITTAGKRLEIRYRDCIRCFCCQEFCPRGAIKVGKGWALKIVK